MDAPSPSGFDFDDHLRRAVERSREGATEILGQLLEAYRPYLLQIANDELDSALQGKAGGSDLVQQTFLEANEDIPNFRGKTEAELVVWLRRILLNNLANFRREFRSAGKRDIDREICLDPADATRLGDLPTREASPIGDVLAREEAASLEQALARLPEDYRQAILLRHQQHCSFAEIGVALGRSAEAARKVWARAIEALQAELGPSQ